MAWKTLSAGPGSRAASRLVRNAVSSCQASGRLCAPIASGERGRCQRRGIVLEHVDLAGLDETVDELAGDGPYRALGLGQARLREVLVEQAPVLILQGRIEIDGQQRDGLSGGQHFTAGRGEDGLVGQRGPHVVVTGDQVVAAVGAAMRDRALRPGIIEQIIGHIRGFVGVEVVLGQNGREVWCRTTGRAHYASRCMLFGLLAAVRGQGYIRARCADDTSTDRSGQHLAYASCTAERRPLRRTSAHRLRVPAREATPLRSRVLPSRHGTRCIGPGWGETAGGALVDINDPDRLVYIYYSFKPD